MPEKGKTDAQRLGEFMILFGAVVSLFFGILYIFNIGVEVSFLPTIDLTGILGALNTLFRGFLLILISLITLATSGKLDISQLKARDSWIIYMVLGIVMYLVGGTLGGLLIIVGAMLLLL